MKTEFNTFKTMLFSLALLLLVYTARAQQQPIRVQGVVADSLGIRLEGALVQVLRLPDSAVLRRAVNNRSGYRLSVYPGDYLLKVSNVGFSTAFRSFKASAADTLVVIPSILLAESGTPLLEVVIQSRIPPVTVRNDTVTYNAGSYVTPPNATVEELLRRLPGIEVDAEGAVTMQGKKVAKVYIDGKEFFLNDPKLPLKMLTADMISKVELSDLKSERAKRTGIKDADNENKVINLRLKDDRKKGTFGRVMGGGGTGERYALGGSINRMNQEQFLSGQLFVDNTNGIALQDGLVGSGHGNSGGIRMTGRQGQQGRGTRGMGSINYRDRWGKVAPTIGYDGSLSDNNVLLQTGRQTFLADSSLRLNSLSAQQNNNLQQNMRTQFEYRPDSMSMWSYSPDFNISRNKSSNRDEQETRIEKVTGSYLANEGITENNQDGHTVSVGNDLSWNRTLNKRGRYVELNAGHNRSENKEDASLKTRLKLYDAAGELASETVLDQKSISKGSSDQLNFGVSFAEPIGDKNSLDVGYTFSRGLSKQNKQSFNYNPATGTYDIPDSRTSNDFESLNTNHRVSAGYNGNMSKLQYQLGLGAAWSALENVDRVQERYIDQQVLNWFPRVTMRYGLASRSSVELTYNGSTAQPTVDQLQPVADLSNPLLIRLGNPNLKPQFDHRFGMNYRSFNTNTSQSLMIGADGSVTERRLMPSVRVLAGGVREERFVNVNGVYNLGVNGVYSLPLGKKNGNIALTSRAGYVNDISLVNGEENVRRGLSFAQNVMVSYRAKEKFYLMAMAGLDYTSSDYSLQRELSTDVLNQNYNLNGMYRLPFDITATLNYNLQVAGAQGGLPGRSVMMMNAYIGKNFLKGKAGEIRVSGFDILNTNTGFAQTIGENYIETRETNVPGRFLMMSLIYNLRRFG